MDTDDGWCEQFPDGTRRWREDAVRRLLEEEDADVVFVAGCEENQSVFHPRLDSIILLGAAIATIVERVTTRTTNPYGTGAGELQKILKDAAEVEPLLRRVAHHEVVTTAPLADVVAEVLRIAAKL